MAQRFAEYMAMVKTGGCRSTIRPMVLYVNRRNQTVFWFLPSSVRCVCVRFIFRLKWISGDRSCVFSYAYHPYLCRSIVTTMDFDKNDWLAHGSCCYCCWLWFLVSLVFRSFYSNTHARAHVITMVEQCIVLYWIGYAWFQVYIQTQTLYLRLINGSRTML